MELHFLNGLLIVAAICAPLVTRRFLTATRVHDLLHAVAVSLVAAALLLEVPKLTVVWPAFCLFGGVQFLRERFSELRTPVELAKGVPFAFSLIGATWLVSGANGLGLLGYGREFSYYAALHSHVLGWMMVGGIALLAWRAEAFNRFFVVAVYGCLVSFLLIAFGIDGVPYIKPIGVAGITALFGLSLVLLVVVARRRSRLGFALGLVSLAGFVFTMTLAWQNELGLALAPFLEARAMVTLHGVVNAVVVAPCFALAAVLTTSD